MQIKTPLEQLFQSGGAAEVKKGRKSPGQVRPLQMLLYGLGYGRALKWASYRADGDYGGSTTAALAAFKSANKLSADGTRLDNETLQLLIDRYKLLPLLREIAAAQASNTTNQLFSGPSGTGKTKELARATGATFSGSIPTVDELQQLMASLTSAYGPDWQTAAYEGDDGGEPVIASDASRHTVADNWVRIRFRRKNKGVWTLGSDTPLDFIQNNGALLESSGLSASSIRVITPVSANEGNLNAINSWDDSFMTFGMFQWTLGQGNNKGELPALLKRIKEEEPTLFQRYFGQYGVDVVGTNKSTGYLSLNGEKVNTVAEKEKFRKGPLWAFRFWVSGLDPRLKKIQVEHALDRINSFWTNDNYRPLNKFYISDLITSEYGICLLLDHHVNRPGHLMSYAIGKKDIVGQALKKAGLADTKPYTWTTAEEKKLLEAYLPLRYASSMTHGQQRAQKIKAYRDKGLLSDERFSYKPAPTSVDRDLDVGGQQDYALIDFKEYEQRDDPAGDQQ